GQVSTDMKANMAISICLRVRDGLQSTELLGDSRAATISPALPGAAYCNDGEHVTAFRCAPADNIDVYCRQIA
ncbi:cell division protein FtsK, partial [Bifidobacterium animalis]|nr:cell division protein FtsK [Bifidobacterium animalis]